jgi:AGCS family alanine or glycine:cation symporter
MRIIDTGHAMMITLEQYITAAANWIWGMPLLLLVSGGGFYFLVMSRFLPFRYFGHGLEVLAGKHDKEGDPGFLSHYKALSVALAATIGMGNIAGVALAISVGGPGAIFWMWISALLGMATKYFTCTLAVMYRGRDDQGELQGGPMYVIREGLGKKWLPLAWLFCIAGMFGCLPIYNTNQLTQAVQDILLVPAGSTEGFATDLAVGLTILTITGIVIFGGLTRIANAVSALVPFMVVVYFIAVFGILALNAAEVPSYFALIFTDAFAANFYNGEAMFGGALGGLIVLGARRAAFSNEAGLGTAPMAHGAAKTSEPVHEGLVAMLGPVIDTLIVCTLTAMAILVTGVWQDATGMKGVELTISAFATAYPGFGGYILLVCILCFGVSSLFSYSYFGNKCFTFLFGAKSGTVYSIIYVASILLGATASMSLIVNFIDFSFAMMAIPTVTSAILLSPKVVRATKDYFSRAKV